MLPPPSLHCNSYITSSFFALPIITERRGGQNLYTPAIERTSSNSLYQGAMLLILKDTSMCANTAEAVFTEKILYLWNDQAYITMVGFDAKSFVRILDKCSPMYSGHTSFHPYWMIVEFEYTCRKKRGVQPKDCLQLMLVWTRTRGLLNILQLVFGLNYCKLSVNLRFGIRLILKTFWNNPHAQKK